MSLIVKDLSAAFQEQQRSAILGQADRRISVALRSMVAAVGASLSADEMARIYEAGGLAALTDYIMERMRANLAPVRDALQDVFIQSGRLSASILADSQDIPAHFALTDEATVQALSSLVTDIEAALTRQVGDMVGSVASRGRLIGESLDQVIADVKSSIGLSERDAQAVTNYRRALETADREALRRELRDRRFDRSIDAAFRDARAIPKDQVDVMASRYRERMVGYRRGMGARLGSLRAIHQADYMFWLQSVRDGLVREEDIARFWSYIHDNRVRHAHMTIPRFNPEGVGLRTPFRSELGPILYPGDPAAAAANVWGCRCTVYVKILTRKLWRLAV